MNSRLFQVIVLSMAAFGMTSCIVEDDNNDNGFSYPFYDGVCQPNYCADGDMVVECDPYTGISTSRQCDYGCADGMCRSSGNASVNPPANACTGDVCRDKYILLVCDAVSGIAEPVVCDYGCDSYYNACRQSPAVSGPACTENICQDESVILICDQTTGVAVPHHCTYGCSGNACNQAPEDVNPPVDPQKCLVDVCRDDKILLDCNTETGEVRARSCDYGCADGMCKKNPDEIPGGSCQPRCRDANVLLSCDENGVINETICLTGCSEGACIDDPLCKNVKCDAGNSCSKGICVPDSMINAADDDDWQDGWVSHCRGTDAIGAYEDIDGKMKTWVVPCGDLGCSVVNIEDEQGMFSSAWCNFPDVDGKCVKENDNFAYCDEIKEDNFAYESSFTCMKNTEGKLTAVDNAAFGDINICEKNMCSGDACMPEAPEEGQVCEYGKTAGSCVKLGTSSFSVNCSSENKTESHECMSGFECLTYEDKGLTTAKCFPFDSACDDTMPQTLITCAGDGVETFECVAASDNRKHYLHKNTEFCSHGCDEAANACIKLIPEEGSACEADTPSYCMDKENKVHCSDGKLTVSSCGGEGAACMTVGGKAECHDTCSVLGETHETCIGIDDAHLYKSVCSASDDENVLYWNESEIRACILGCADSTACVDDLTADGTKCVEAADKKCKDTGHAGCAVNEKGHPFCYDDTCKEVGEVAGSRQCVEDKYAASVYYDACYATKGNGNVLVKKVSDLCDDKCNADKSDCAPAAK